MKINLLTPALAALLGFALAGAPMTSHGQTSTNADTVKAPTMDTTTTSTKSMKPVKYSGSITAIDATSVTVTSTKKTLTLAITPTTTFKKDKETATLADFAVGDQVTGSYTKDSTGAMMAHSLHKKTMKPMTTSTTAPATPAAQ